MGSIPSREIQESPSGFHFALSGVHAMALIPLTPHYFPSANCIAFQQLFECRDRQSAKYNYSLLNASSSQPQPPPPPYDVANHCNASNSVKHKNTKGPSSPSPQGKQQQNSNNNNNNNNNNKNNNNDLVDARCRPYIQDSDSTCTDGVISATDQQIEFKPVRTIDENNFSTFYPEGNSYKWCPEDDEPNPALPYRPAAGSSNSHNDADKDIYFKDPQSLYDFLVTQNTKNGGLVETNAEMCALYAEEMKWQEARKIVRAYRKQQKANGDGAATSRPITQEEVDAAAAVPAPSLFLRPGPEVIILRMTPAEEAAAKEEYRRQNPPHAAEQTEGEGNDSNSNSNNSNANNNNNNKNNNNEHSFAVHLSAYDATVTEEGLFMGGNAHRYRFEDVDAYKDGRVHLVEEDGVLYIFAYNAAYVKKMKAAAQAKKRNDAAVAAHIHESGSLVELDNVDHIMPPLSSRQSSTAYALASSFGDHNSTSTHPPHRSLGIMGTSSDEDDDNDDEDDDDDDSDYKRGHKKDDKRDEQLVDAQADRPHILQLQTEAKFVLPICPVRIVGCNAFVESKCRGTPWLRGCEDDPEEDAYVESLNPRPPVMHDSSFIDASIGDKILSRAFMLSFQTYRDTCMAAGLPDSLTRPFWNYSLLSNIPVLQISREMRFRARVAAAEVERGFAGLRDLIEGTEYDLKSYICHPTVFEKLIWKAKAAYAAAHKAGSEAKSSEAPDDEDEEQDNDYDGDVIKTNSTKLKDINEEMTSLLQNIKDSSHYFDVNGSGEKKHVVPEGPLPKRLLEKKSQQGGGDALSDAADVTAADAEEDGAAEEGAGGSTEADNWHKILQKRMLFPQHEAEYGVMTTIRADRMLARVRPEAQNTFFFLVSLATAPVSTSQFMKPLNTSAFDYGGTVSMHTVTHPVSGEEQAQVLSPPNNLALLRQQGSDSNKNSTTTKKRKSKSDGTANPQPLMVYVVTDPSPQARGAAKQMREKLFREKKRSIRRDSPSTQSRQNSDEVVTVPAKMSEQHQYLYDAATFTDGDLVVYDVYQGKWKHLDTYYYQRHFEKAILSDAPRSTDDNDDDEVPVEDIQLADILLCWVKTKLYDAVLNPRHDPGWLREANSQEIVREGNYYIWGFEHDKQRFYYGLIPKFAREKKKKTSSALRNGAGESADEKTTTPTTTPTIAVAVEAFPAPAKAESHVEEHNNRSGDHMPKQHASAKARRGPQPLPKPRRNAGNYKDRYNLQFFDANNAASLYPPPPRGQGSPVGNGDVLSYTNPPIGVHHHHADHHLQQHHLQQYQHHQHQHHERGAPHHNSSRGNYSKDRQHNQQRHHQPNRSTEKHQGHYLEPATQQQQQPIPFNSNGVQQTPTHHNNASTNSHYLQQGNATSTAPGSPMGNQPAYESSGVLSSDPSPIYNNHTAPNYGGGAHNAPHHHHAEYPPPPQKHQHHQQPPAQQQQQQQQRRSPQSGDSSGNWPAMHQAHMPQQQSPPPQPQEQQQQQQHTIVPFAQEEVYNDAAGQQWSGSPPPSGVNHNNNNNSDGGYYIVPTHPTVGIPLALSAAPMPVIPQPMYHYQPYGDLAAANYFLDGSGAMMQPYPSPQHYPPQHPHPHEQPYSGGGDSRQKRADDGGYNNNNRKNNNRHNNNYNNNNNTRGQRPPPPPPPPAPHGHHMSNEQAAAAHQQAAADALQTMQYQHGRYTWNPYRAN